MLRAFAAAVAGIDGIDDARSALGSRLDDPALVEAAAVVAVFHGFVRVADGTGLPVDELVMATSGDLRAELGIDAFPGRANSAASGSILPPEAFDPALGA